MVDLDNSSLTCNSLGVRYGTWNDLFGALLGNTPIVCGGTYGSNGQTCTIFVQSRTISVIMGWVTTRRFQNFVISILALWL